MNNNTYKGVPNLRHHEVSCHDNDTILIYCTDLGVPDKVFMLLCIELQIA